MTVRITSPSGRSGRTRIGPTELRFDKGVALVEGELRSGVRAFLDRNGYTVEDVTVEDEGPFDPAKHNQDQVIEHLERDDIDDDERARVVSAEADGKARKGVREWAEAYLAKRDEAREAAEKEAREAAEKAAAEGQGGGEDQ